MAGSGDVPRRMSAWEEPPSEDKGERSDYKADERDSSSRTAAAPRARNSNSNSSANGGAAAPSRRAIKKSPSASASAAASSVEVSGPAATAGAPCEWARALYDYTPSATDVSHLALRKGDTIEVGCSRL